MARTTPFEAHAPRYEQWFVDHAAAYRAELAALRALLPEPGFALEVGVGTGRFAAPLGVPIGVDPSVRMLAEARRRGIRVACGIAEALPFREAAFAHVLIVTTICFVDDPARMLAEVRRVLRPGGAVVIGLIDRDTPLGRHYLAHRAESVFYQEATFYAAAEVGALLAGAGFRDCVWRQTLGRPLDETTPDEPVRPGTGEGAFVAVRAEAA